MEANPNLNKRVSMETKLKIEEILKRDDITAKDLFKKMVTLYEDNQLSSDNLPNFAIELENLALALTHISNTYSNIVSKTNLHIGSLSSNYEEKINNIELSIAEKYQNIINKLESEKTSLQEEYDMISKEASLLINESKELRKNNVDLQNRISQNEELLSQYKIQISTLNENNQILNERLTLSTSKDDIENIKKEHSMEILTLNYKHQEELNKIKEEHQKEVIRLKDMIAAEKDKQALLYSQYIETKKQD